MKHFTTKLLAVCVLLAMAGGAQAQVFYQQLFNNPGLPAGWTTTDPSGNGVLWERCTNVNTDCHTDEYGYPLFEGSDKANGFMILDSDAAGAVNGSHQSRLTSAAIDCSGKSEVYALFESQIGVFDFAADDNAKLFVSNNGTTWTAFQIFDGVTGTTTDNRFSENPEVSGIDISSVAANQSTVYLRWEWVGNYEYWWILDKVELTTVNPAPANDLAVADFFYPVSSFATPESQIGSDTFAFVAYVSNLGTAAQTNVKAYAYVLGYDDAGNLLGLAFVDSVSVASIEPGVDSLELSFPNRFAPELPAGLYAVAYEVTADLADQHDTDNFVGDFFQVTDVLFAKENSPQTASRPADGGDWAVGNYYRMGTAQQPLFKAVGAEFSFATDEAILPVEDVNVEIALYRINDDVEEDFSNFEPDGSSMTLIGTAPFDAPDGAASYDLFTSEIFDIATAESGVELEPNGRYILAASYVGANADAYTAFNSNVRADFVSTILYIGGEWGGNFVGRPNAVLRMYLDMIVSSTETPLPEVALNVMPNPTSEYVNLKMKFEEPTETTIIIGDINGRVIRTETRKVFDETVTYRMPELASGTYIARIVTDKGTRTLNFVVQK